MAWDLLLEVEVVELEPESAEVEVEAVAAEVRGAYGDHLRVEHHLPLQKQKTEALEVRRTSC